MKILVLSTWFPYPVNQGSKIRAYHLIKALSSQHQVVLISYEDQPIKEEWLTHMRQFCEDIVIVPRKPFEYTRINTLLGFFSKKPSAVYAGYSKEMEKTVTETANKLHPDLVFAFTFVTAPYALKVPSTKRIVDVDNLLAEMLKEDISFAKNSFQKLRRYLAYLKFRNYEDKIYSPFDRCLVVSDQDKIKFQSYTSTTAEHILNIPNGVDADFLKPIGKIKDKNQLIYNGALTYQPNFDAMAYFISEILPSIQKEVPDIKIKITGKTDGVALDQFPLNDKVELTGYLDDIRPVVAASEICVVPLRQGAGTRLKILESMALGTAVVSTSKGAEGLDLQDGVHLLIADNPIEFSKATIKLLKDPQLRSDLEHRARKLIELKYDWKLIGDQFTAQVNRLMNIEGVE